MKRRPWTEQDIATLRALYQRAFDEAKIIAARKGEGE